MKLDAFFASVRGPVFGGKLSQRQVDGCKAILNEAGKRGTPLRHLSYILATPVIETGAKMQPVSENLNYSAKRLTQVWPSRFPTLSSAKPYANNPTALAEKVYGGRMGNTKPGDGWLFRGRGLSQITGRDNYTKFGIASNPDAALQMPVAVQILFDGMINGMFTGVKLADFITETERKNDYYNARRTVNGTDRAADIAVTAKAFEKALVAAGYDGKSAVGIPTSKPTPTPATKGAGLVAVVLAALAAVGAWFASLPCSIFEVFCR